jgi:FeS assembly SUF system protein
MTEHHLPVLPKETMELNESTSPAATPAASPETTPPASASPAPDGSAAGAPATPDVKQSIDLKLLEGRVIEVLRTIYDPEIPVNIHELGLIYNVDVLPDRSVKVTMTLTAPACPVAGTLPGEVERKIEAIPEVTKANVELVWEPPWCREMMSEAAQLQLGFM